MIYTYLLVQIHSSDSFFRVGFILCVIFFQKKMGYRWGSTAFRLQSHYLLLANSEKYTLADCVLSINDYSNRGWGIHFHKF